MFVAIPELFFYLFSSSSSSAGRATGCQKSKPDVKKRARLRWGKYKGVQGYQVLQQCQSCTLFFPQGILIFLGPNLMGFVPKDSAFE